MTGIPDARSGSISGTAISALPVTLFTVPAGQIWRLWDAYVQMNMQGTSAMAVQSTLDLILEIQGGDTLVACSCTLINPSSGDSVYASLEQGGRALGPGTVVRLKTAFGLPANTVARATCGALWSTS